MRRYSLLRLVTTVAAALVVAGLLYYSHPGWFDTGANLTLPPVAPRPTGGPTAISRSTHVKPTPTVAIPRVGMAQHLDDVWINPTRVSHINGTRTAQPNIGDIFLAVHVLIQNRSQYDYPVRLSAFEVIDSHRVIDPPLTENITHQGLREVSLAPRGYISGVLVFEVPAADPQATLIYQPDPLNPTKRKEWVIR
jgi:hypothetical protein